jgi:hypothetical protein
MPFAIGDLVQVDPALAERGATSGWQGYVTLTVGGPGPAGSYQVTRRYGESSEVGEMLVPEEQIAAGPLDQGPVPVLGAFVALFGEPGVVTAINGDLYTVEIEVPLTRRRWARRGGAPMGEVTYLRRHVVPLHRLRLEN